MQIKAPQEGETDAGLRVKWTHETHHYHHEKVFFFSDPLDGAYILEAFFYFYFLGNRSVSDDCPLVSLHTMQVVGQEWLIDWSWTSQNDKSEEGFDQNGVFLS